MPINWLLDADIFGSYRENLVSAIKNHGDQVKLVRVPSPPFRWEDEGCSYRETFDGNSRVVFHGDIELANRIHREQRWTPGAFFESKNYFWSHYVCHLEQFLLNRDYVMLPFGEIQRQSSDLFKTIGLGDQFFVRPDSPLKLFTGQKCSRSTLQKDLEFLSFYEFPPSSLIVISSPKNIVEVWRFIVVDGEVVSGSKYRDLSGFKPSGGFTKEAESLAMKVASHGFQPDLAWTLDICRTEEGSHHVLEIGAFSCSDLYACDLDAVVSSVSRAVSAAY